MRPKKLDAPTVCAVVVTYFPDTDFESRLLYLLPQLDALVVVDNTPDCERLRHLSLPVGTDQKICLIENSGNLGVATALNQGLTHALQWGNDYVLTLDQDSYCYENIVQTLLKVNTICVPTPVVVGGNYLDTRNQTLKVPLGDDGEFLDQKTVITSGCLVDARFAKTIGGFRDDYFIDQLDHEFCLRARAHGGRVVISRKPVMDHSVGEDGGVSLPIVGQFPNHPPLRKYYIARNSIVTILEYWWREPAWCLVRTVRLFLGFIALATIESNRAQKIRAFILALWDAVNHRMGVCNRPSIQQR